MIRTLVRACALAAGAAVALSALATPAAAEEIVPPGCVGSIYYVCTSSAEPPGARYVVSFEQFPVPGRQIVPGTTVGGQQIGGVVVLLGAQSVPGTSTTVGGATAPVQTGVVLPVGACAFVACYPAGTSVVVPGIPLPVVPVVVPTVTTPEQAVSVPTVAVVPVTTTPAVTSPSNTVYLPGDVTLYNSDSDALVAAIALCTLAGVYPSSSYQYQYASYGGSFSCSTPHGRAVELLWDYALSDNPVW